MELERGDSSRTPFASRESHICVLPRNKTTPIPFSLSFIFTNRIVYRYIHFFFCLIIKPIFFIYLSKKENKRRQLKIHFITPINLITKTIQKLVHFLRMAFIVLTVVLMKWLERNFPKILGNNFILIET